MSRTSLMPGLYIFVLGGFVGYQVISRVPPLLHTPLMSGTNAISGDLARRLARGGRRAQQLAIQILGFIAVFAATHQRGRRVPHHRPHASDVRIQGSSGREGCGPRKD